MDGVSDRNRFRRSRALAGRTAVAAALLLGTSLGGCQGELPSVPDSDRLDGLEFSGGVDVAESFPVQLGFDLRVRNTADRELHLVSDGCGVLPRAYGSASRTGEPAWDGRPGAPCLAHAAPVTLAPGEVRRFSRSYSARDVLGDSLPDGRYFFTVTYRAALALDGEPRLVEVTAGEAELALPREGS